MKLILSNKYFWLFIMILGLNLPLAMVESQVEERVIQRDVAKDLVRQSWTGEQELFIGLLVVPYQEKVKISPAPHSGNYQVDAYEWHNKLFYIIPERINIDASLNNQSLNKGIYNVPVYTATLNVFGEFELKTFHQFKNKSTIRMAEKAFISIGVLDSRGLVGIPEMSIGDNHLEVEPGSGLPFYSSGFSGVVSDASLSKKHLSFNSTIKVNGMQELSFLTTARTNKVKAQSDWQHPNFKGAYLPVERSISEDGYTATWETGVFSTNMETILENCFQNNCQQLASVSYGVGHIEPVDIYLQSLRAIKYGMLIILVTFCIFVLYELITQRIAIHPISYGLTGAALAIFFLLLIALSEHMIFATAYWISSIACSGLIAFYIFHQTQSLKQGLGLMLILNSLYFVLFFIIRSEDHALLSGSLLLFFLLATVMAVTRKFDWYKVLNFQNSISK
ncbi:MAG: cell envelope integrity protein CreD [Gammaproteobacteria bacterium]|nr:cell envelope integrity protein CreD [Gammaproteobacteria bacterium]